MRPSESGPSAAWPGLPGGFLQRHPTRIIGIGFVLVITLMLALAAMTLFRLERIQESVREISREHTAHSYLAHRMYHTARERSTLLMKVMHEDDPFVADEYTLRFHALGAEFGVARQKLMQHALTEQERGLLEKQRAATVRTQERQKEALELYAAGKRHAAEEALIEGALPSQEEALSFINQILYLQTDEIQAAADKAHRQEQEAHASLLAGVGAATLISLLIAVFVQRNISRLTRNLGETTQRLQLSLRDLEFQKRALDQHAIVSIADRAGRIIYVNDLFCQVSQYSAEELLGSDHRIVNSGQHPRAFFEDMWQTISSGHTWQGKVCNRRKNGSHYWVDTTILPFPGEDGLPERYVSVRTDITAIKDAEVMLQMGKHELESLVAERTDELRESEEVLRKITSSAQDAIVMIDQEDRVTFWNAAAERLFGYRKEEIVGQPLHPLIMPAAMQVQQNSGFQYFIASGEGPLIDKTTEVTALRRDGSAIPVELSLSAVLIKDRWCGIGIARDISERKRSEVMLRQIAETDSLTGIANRRKFNEVLQAEIGRSRRHSQPLTLILLDIDHFKAINDCHGHQVGDQVLVELARLVTGHIRAYDVFARWGGEEFAVLATNSDAGDSRQFAEKLRALIDRHHFPGVGHVTASLGLATYQVEEPPDRFLGRADQALYQAKTSGRNRVESA
jgi:diguanylate cyclase (GGDEF)-like protein/PAS domain S-box-containing protein